MDALLIFFAFPIAVIIFSIVLERLLRNPIAVTSLVFAVFLIVAFAAFDEMFLIAVLAYTVLSFVTALIVYLIQDRKEHNVCDVLSDFIQNVNNNNGGNNNSDNESMCDTVQDLLGTNNNNSNNNDSNNGSNGCNCRHGRYMR